MANSIVKQSKVLFEEYQNYKFDLKQPSLITNVVLKSHQLQCLKWLSFLHLHNLSGLLADEMGLGKTLEAISFMAYLTLNSLKSTLAVHQHHDHQQALFIVVCPLSTVDNWQREIQLFFPSSSLIVYTGNKDERERKRKHIVDYIVQRKKNEVNNTNNDSNLMSKLFNFDILLTTPQIVMMDIAFLCRFEWDLIVVDEAHNLKNENALLHETLLNDLKSKMRLPMTGTPVQNNLKELYSLLHFANPDIFNDSKSFVSHFADLSSPNINNNNNNNSKSHLQKEIHSILSIFMLRRYKTDVLSDLPKKTEILIYSGLSALQKKLYKSLLKRDAVGLLNENNRAMVNLVMSLRKTANHPYLFEGIEPEPFQEGEHIIAASGKLTILDKLLKKLKRDGSRVLIFSQFTSMLDILQDFLSYRKYSYERLDGSVRAQDRYTAISRFTTISINNNSNTTNNNNNSNTESFCFLLSTRAGGQGLNLTSANVVIFFDSDWNPQVDIQAAARCFRIGQTKPVQVIRLIARHTIDDIMFQRALKKKKLSVTVIDTMDSNADNKNDDDGDDDDDMKNAKKLKQFIQYGLEYIFSNDESTITDEDIDAILNSAKHLNDSHENQQQQHQQQQQQQQQQQIDKVEDDDLNSSLTFVKKTTRTGTITIKSLDAIDNDNDIDNNDNKDAKILQNIIHSPSSASASASKKGVTNKTDVIVDQPSMTRSKTIIGSSPLTEEKLRKEKEEKQLLKKYQKWVDNGYQSLVVHPVTSASTSTSTLTSKLDNNFEREDDEEEGEELQEKRLIYVTGDCSTPKKTGTQGNSGNRIILMSVDDSGAFGHGGFFTALAKKFPNVPIAYEDAGNNDDLELGSVHLIKVTEAKKAKRNHTEEDDNDDADVSGESSSEDENLRKISQKYQVVNNNNNNNNNNDKNNKNENDLYVCLIVVQQRKAGKVSGLLHVPLVTALKTLCQKAKDIHATIHLPRLGDRSTWYVTEKSLQRYLASQNIDTYVYYYTKNSNTGMNNNSVRRRNSISNDHDDNGDDPTAAAADDDDGDGDDDDDDKDNNDHDHIEKKLKYSKLPLDNKRICLYDVDDATWSQWVEALGGKTVANITSASIIVTDYEYFDDSLYAFHLQYPKIPIVSCDWLQYIIDHRSPPLTLTSYIISPKV